MAMFTNIRRDRRGSTAVEFALVVPIFLMLFFGVVQVGILFHANAGLQNAVGDAARLATLWPRRTQAQLTTELDASRFGLNPARVTEQFTFGQAGGQDFVEIQMDYTTSLDFGFFEFDGITLSHSRRAYRP